MPAVSMIAAKHVPTSGYISARVPYCVFTIVNRNRPHDQIPRTCRRDRTGRGCTGLPGGPVCRAFQRYPGFRAVLSLSGADRRDCSDHGSPPGPLADRGRWYVSVRVLISRPHAHRQCPAAATCTGRHPAGSVASCTPHDILCTLRGIFPCNNFLNNPKMPESGNGPVWQNG